MRHGEGNVLKDQVYCERLGASPLNSVECGKVYPQAKRLLITADGGGSNGSRCRLWKVELQRLADEIGLRISVCHFPPGTSKWNKIEHRMFCHITENWRGRPLVSREVVVNLIGHTTTKTGLAIRSELDENSYPTGREVTRSEEHTSELQSQSNLVCRLLLEKKKKNNKQT